MKIYRNSYTDTRKKRHAGYSYHDNLIDSGAQARTVPKNITVAFETLDVPLTKRGLMGALRHCGSHPNNP
jgi:hypothetical protein